MGLDVKALAIGIIEEYGTNDPYLIAQYLNINLLFHDLPSSLDAYRLNNIIVINTDLSFEKRKWVLAHELGHYFIHGPEYTLSNYISNKLLIKAKCEKQADIFASELLLANINDYVVEGLTSKELASLIAVPEEYIEYKLAK